MRRLLLGAFLGLCLAGYSSAFVGIGHGGTFAPIGFASSVLAFMVEFGPVIPVLGTPILWGLYFLLIPDIESKGLRLGVLSTALGLHVLIGALFYHEEPGYGGSLVPFFVLFLISVSLLIYVSTKESQKESQAPRQNNTLLR